MTEIGVVGKNTRKIPAPGRFVLLFLVFLLFFRSGLYHWPCVSTGRATFSERNCVWLLDSVEPLQTTLPLCPSFGNLPRSSITLQISRTFRRLHLASSTFPPLVMFCRSRGRPSIGHRGGNGTVRVKGVSVARSRALRACFALLVRRNGVPREFREKERGIGWKSASERSRDRDGTVVEENTKGRRV